MYTVPPAHCGSLGSGSAAAPVPAASDQRVSTSPVLILVRASATARSYPMRPSGGSGTYSRMSCSRQTTSCTSESISGAAMARGTGVTRFTQCDESRGVSTGTGSTRRAGSSATAA